MDPTRNFAEGVILTAPSPALSGTTVILQSGHGAYFPDPLTEGEFNVSVWPSSEAPGRTNTEIVRVTAKSGDTLTIAREQEGTTAKSIQSGYKFGNTSTSKMFSDIADELDGLDSRLTTAEGSIVSISSTVVSVSSVANSALTAANLRQLSLEKNQVNGYAGLDSSGKIDIGQIPALGLGISDISGLSTALSSLSSAIASVSAGIPTTTDALTEGLTNLYHTSARVNTLIAAATLSQSQVTSLVSDLAAKEVTLTFSSPLSRSVNTISIPIASGSTSGYLSATDWTTFNNKQATIVNTDSLTEGSTNLYYTNTRVDARIAAATITESQVTNLVTDLAAKLNLSGGTLTGNLLFSTDNTLDIGAIGATRPRTVYAGTSFLAPLGSGTAPSFGFADDLGYGFYHTTASGHPTYYAVNGVNPAFAWTSSFEFKVTSAGFIGFCSASATTGLDTILTRESAAVFQLGSDAASPVAQTLKGCDARAGTDTNTAGGNLTIAAGRNTGSAAGGSLLFQTAPAGSSGTGAGTLTTRLTIDSTGASTFTGVLLAPNGTTSAPAFAFSGETNTGFYWPATGQIGFLQTGTERARFYSGGLHLSSGNWVTWGSSFSVNDLILQRDAAAVLQMGSDAASPVAQTFKGPDARAGTDTNTVGGNLTIAAGRNTGSAAGGSLIFQTAPAGSSGTAAGTLTTRLTLDSTGLLTSALNAIGSTVTDSLQLSNTTAATSGAQQYSPALRFTGQGWSSTSSASQATDWRVYSVPVSGSTNPSSTLRFEYSVNGGAFTNVMTLNNFGHLTMNTGRLISGDDVQAAGGNSFLWNARSKLRSSADGLIELFNNAANDFTRLNFGGTTSSFPALARSSATLICKLADDSANAAFEALSFKTANPSGGTSQPWKFGSKVAASVSLDTANYVELDVNGTLCKLALVT